MPAVVFLLLSAAGGVVGASARWGLVTLVPDDRVAAATVAVNVVGSAVAGGLAGWGLRPDRCWWPLAVTGFCGGFTTFSAFAVQVAEHLAAERVGAAATLAAVTVALTLPAAGVGWRLARHRRRGSARQVGRA